jgi:hypothetical protein
MHSTELHLICTPTSSSVDSRELEELVLELKSEIERAPGSGYQIKETYRHNKDALGPEWLPILTAIITSHLAVELVKSLTSLVREWLARQKPVTVTIKGPNGEYTVTGEHMAGAEIERIAAHIVTGKQQRPLAR